MSDTCVYNEYRRNVYSDNCPIVYNFEVSELKITSNLLVLSLITRDVMWHCRVPPSTGVSTQSGSEPTNGEAPGDQEESTSHGNDEGSGEGGEERKASITSKPEVSTEVMFAYTVSTHLYMFEMGWLSKLC